MKPIRIIRSALKHRRYTRNEIIRAVRETEPIAFEPGKRDGEVVYRYDSVSEDGEEFTVLVVDQPEYLLIIHANPLKWSTK